MYMMVVIHIHCVQGNSLWRARLWHISASLCKNENGICTQAELQAIAELYLLKLGWERM